MLGSRPGRPITKLALLAEGCGSISIAVVRFMKHTTRRQLSVVELKLIAVNIMRSHNRSQTSLNWRKDSRKRQAAFLAILIALDMNHFWIDHHNPLVGIFAARTVHYK